MVEVQYNYPCLKMTVCARLERLRYIWLFMSEDDNIRNAGMVEDAAIDLPEHGEDVAAPIMVALQCDLTTGASADHVTLDGGQTG